MKNMDMPAVIQSVGLACVPVHDMPLGEAALGRRPVAAAVVTLQARTDGHRDIVASTLSDARDSEFPLPWLVDQALAACAPTIITPDDRALLAVDAMARRHCAEPKLAELCAGEHAVDPTVVFGERLNETALCRRLQIPTAMVGDADVERAWSRHAPDAAMDVALGVALARLMLWAHATAFAAGEPDAFFETMLPLRDWMLQEETAWPSLARAVRSRPVARATSFASAYRTYVAARDAGEPAATWVQFEDGLFHT